MDIISAIAVATSVFQSSMALVVLFVRLPIAGEHRTLDQGSGGVTQRVMATSLVVYFVAILNLLLIAQQGSLALGTFVVGLVTLVVYYVEPAIRTRGSQATEEGEGWEG